jgi:hypothetical protein
MRNRRQFITTSLGVSSLTAWIEALAMGQKPLQNGIRRLKGDVQLNDKLAALEQAVLPGDTLRTGPQSEVVYVTGNSAYLLRENTVVQTAQDGSTGVLRLITGKALAAFGPGPRRIETQAATIGIRGTACYFEASNQQLYFCLCYGSADVQSVADPSQSKSYTTRYHDMPMYISAVPGQTIFRPAPMINHKDAELILLEETVGRQPPFVSDAAAPVSSY